MADKKQPSDQTVVNQPTPTQSAKTVQSATNYPAQAPGREAPAVSEQGSMQDQAIQSAADLLGIAKELAQQLYQKFGPVMFEFIVDFLRNQMTFETTNEAGQPVQVNHAEQCSRCCEQIRAAEGCCNNHLSQCHNPKCDHKRCCEQTLKELLKAASMTATQLRHCD